MRAILEACAVDDPRCDDTADLFGDQLDLMLIGAAVIVVIAVVIDRTLGRRVRRGAAGTESGSSGRPPH